VRLMQLRDCGSASIDSFADMLAATDFRWLLAGQTNYTTHHCNCFLQGMARQAWCARVQVCVLQVPGRTDGMVRDLHVSYHWRKLLLFLPMTGVVVWTAVRAQRRAEQHLLDIKYEDGFTECSWGSHLTCTLPWQARTLPAACASAVCCSDAVPCTLLLPARML
jgi:hypothetical protein